MHNAAPNRTKNIAGRIIASALTGGVALAALSLFPATARAQDVLYQDPCSRGSFTFQTRFTDGKISPGSAIYLQNGYAPGTGGHLHSNFGHPLLNVRNAGPGYSNGAGLWNTDIVFPCIAGLYEVIANVVNPNGVVTSRASYFLVQLNRPMTPFGNDPQIRSYPALDSVHPGAVYLRREVTPQADSLMFNIKESYPDANIALTHVGLMEGGWYDWDRSWFQAHAGHDQGTGFDVRIQFNGPPEVIHSHIQEAGCSGYSLGGSEWHIDCPGSFRIGPPAGHGR